MDSQKQAALDIAVDAIGVAVKTLEQAASQDAAQKLDAARKVMFHLQHTQMVMEPLLEPLVRGTFEYNGAVLHGVHQEHDVCGLVRVLLQNTQAVMELMQIPPAGVTLELPGGAQ